MEAVQCGNYAPSKLQVTMISADETGHNLGKLGIGERMMNSTTEKFAPTPLKKACSFFRLS